MLRNRKAEISEIVKVYERDSQDKVEELFYKHCMNARYQQIYLRKMKKITVTANEVLELVET